MYVESQWNIASAISGTIFLVVLLIGLVWLLKELFLFISYMMTYG